MWMTRAVYLREVVDAMCLAGEKMYLTPRGRVGQSRSLICLPRRVVRFVGICHLQMSPGVPC
jgi:hypothetical protein